MLGIGYNSLESYTNALDISKLDGLCHHLYHGVDENNPYASDVFSKVGAFHPELPHFQTEYSRGDWFSLAGLIYKSYHDEEVVSYLYWDLIWGDNGGLVTVEFPWDSDRWTDPTKGYVVNMEYYAFKQFSAFIQPGWKRIASTLPGEEIKVLSFVNPGQDSMTSVFINRSETSTRKVNIGIEGYRISKSAIYTTSETEKCSPMGSLRDSLLTLAPHSITTLTMLVEAYDPQDDTEAPSVPDSLRASDLSHDSFTLRWDESTDNVGVKYYKIFMDGDSLGSTSLNEFMLSELEMGLTYEVAVSAVDDAGNESTLSEALSVTTLVVDLDPPVLECSDSIYQEGSLELISSEDGIVYLVPSGCEGDITTIRSLFMDSLTVEGGVAVSLPIKGLENGAYWLYARDSVNNLSNHAEFIVFGWDLDPPVLECSDSIYQEGSLELISSEDGIVYLVPSGCEGDITTIRSLFMDSLTVEGGVAVSLPISGLENGAYWLYARDSVNNISMPAEFSVYGVGMSPVLLEGFSIYPNPMKESVNFEFTLRESAALWIFLYDSQGVEVRKEFLGELHEGAQQILLQREDLIPGLYLFRLRGKEASLKSGRLIINR